MFIARVSGSLDDSVIVRCKSALVELPKVADHIRLVISSKNCGATPFVIGQIDLMQLTNPSLRSIPLAMIVSFHSGTCPTLIGEEAES